VDTWYVVVSAFICVADGGVGVSDRRDILLMATILIGGLLCLAVVVAARKYVNDLKNHRCCGNCSGCTGKRSCKE